MPEQLVVGVRLDGFGAHPAAGEAAGRNPLEVLAPQWLRDTTTELENAGYSFIVFPDGESADAATARLDPIEAASFAAAWTDRIGLVPATSATHAEPYHLSNQLSSLDWASHGRAGWQVAADASFARARAHGLPAAPDQDAARREADEVIDATRRLWDSWEDGALIADSRAGRFLDRDKIHYTDYRGEFVAVRGPALLPRPIQGQPVVFSARDEISGRLIDVELVTAPTEHQLLGAPPPLAARRFVEIEVALDAASGSGGQRISDLDETRKWRATGALRFVGSADELVALLQRLASTVDGVVVHPAVVQIDAAELAARVLPQLRSAGMYESPTAGDTLRDQLRLPRPISRYAAAGQISPDDEGVVRS